VRQVADGTKVGVKLELFSAGATFDAGKAASDGGGRDRTFEPNSGAFDGFDQLLGNVFVVFLIRFRAPPGKFPIQISDRWLRGRATAAPVTSGPMPSPGMRVILYAIEFAVARPGFNPSPQSCCELSGISLVFSRSFSFGP